MTEGGRGSGEAGLGHGKQLFPPVLQPPMLLN